MTSFLPVSKSQAPHGCDVIVVTGDAYIDHPSFGAAVIGRVLQHAGFSVGIIAQPQTDQDFMALGAPRLFFGVTSGNLDSMVANYTATAKPRSDDAYTPGGVAGKRPDRATMVYTNRLQSLYKGVPVVLGGLEASMRRVAHYDYWSNKVRNSLLADCKAQVLVYGMAESTIVELANYFKDKGEFPTDLPGTVVFKDPQQDDLILPDAAACRNKQVYMQTTHAFMDNYQQRVLYQKAGGRYIKHNPPSAPASQQQLDSVYELPFTRLPHPMYKKPIPAWAQINTSVNSHRGCFGGCSFCAIALHQGKMVSSRSSGSVLNEIKHIARQSYFKGTISDIGGPSANMYASYCSLGKGCKRQSCLVPTICKNLVSGQQKHLKLLEQSAALPGVKHVFVASGIRHDLALTDKTYTKALSLKFTGGHLKLAPEHKSPKVLKKMCKPSFDLYESFENSFAQLCKQHNLKRFIVPYIIVGHPGADYNDTIELALWLKKRNIKLQQIQQFTPTPLSISTAMYYTGIDYETGAPINVPKGRDLTLMKAIVQWYKPQNTKYIKELLHKAGRDDLLKVFDKRVPKAKVRF